MEIPTDSIFVSGANVRTREVEQNLVELRESIGRIGLLQPLVVMAKDDKYELIVGQRRYLAVKELGWEKVPALVIGRIDPIKAKVLSLSENIQRRSLPYRDMVDACDALFDKYRSVDAVADELSVANATVQIYLAHRIVPEPVKEMVEEGKITRQDAIKVTNAMWPEIVEGDEKKAVILAEEISKMPREEKKRAFEIATDQPDLEPVEITKKAKEPPPIMRLTIHVPTRYGKALGRASKDLDLDPEDVAKTALIDWLLARGYTD